MAAFLDELKGKKIMVITNDGRHLVGVLKGFDKSTNVLLTSCIEYIYSENEGAQTVELGLMLLKGDNFAMTGLINKTKDADIDYESIKAPPMKAIKH